MTKVFTSWSGGKDSCFACCLAAADGLDVRYLANMVTEDGKKSWTHGLTSDLLQLQAQAMGIPLVQRRTTGANYENEFKNMILSMKKEGISGGVFGDIDFEEHRQWIENVCRKVDVTPYLPLWGRSQDKIMRDFIDLGFESVVVAARAEFFDDAVLGRVVDHDFIKYLASLPRAKEITPCGEAGEYHSFVINGPLFKKRVEIAETRKTTRDGVHFLEIVTANLKDKR